jgi:hypothetical protein
VLLALFGLTLLLDAAPAPTLILTAILGVMAVEAALRRRLRYLVLGVATVAGLVIAVVLFVTHWRFGLGVTALIASIALALSNFRAMIARR